MKNRYGCLVIFLIFFTLFWTAMVGIFDTIFISDFVRREQAQSFPSTKGTIMRSYIKETQGSRRSADPTYGPEIDFTFEVNGKTYSSDTYRYGDWGSSDRSLAESAVGRYVVGQQVVVYYNPNDPSDAILERDTQGMDLFSLLAITPFNLIMLGLWGFLATMLKRKISKLPAGGVLIKQYQGRTHIRLPESTPLATAGGTALGISFVSIFIVFFGFGANPSMLTIQIVWACVIIPSVIVYIKMKFDIGSGKKDLVIDDTNGILSLAQTLDRNEHVIVQLDDVTEVIMERVAIQTRKGTRFQFAAALVYTEGDKSIKSRLIEWYDEDRANQFADWLRDRLGLTK